MQHVVQVKREAEANTKDSNRIEEQRKAELEELVSKRYPIGDQSVTSTISKIIEQKRQVRETQTFRSIDVKPMTGYINTKDLMEL